MAPRKKTDTAAPKAGKKKPTKAEQTAALVAKDDIERVQVTKDVPQIADAVSAQRQAHELAKVTLELKQHETELAAFGAEKRKKMRPLRKEQQRLANAVDGNTIMRRVTVFEVRDYKLNQVRYEGVGGDGKPDGKAVPGLDVVVMSPEMRQRTIFDDDAGGPRTAAEEEAEGEEEEDLVEGDEPEDE